MAAPFEVQPVPQRSFLDRLLRRPLPIAVAEAELLNCFANARSVRHVDRRHLADIQERYGFDPRIALVPLLESIFRRYFSYCVADQQLTDDEVDDLVHLKQLFEMPDTVAREIHDQLAGPYFRAAAEERLGAGPPSKETLDFLLRLQDRLLLSDRYAEAILRQVAESIVLEAERRAVEDRALSPDEARELIALAQSLGVEWPTSDSDLHVLDRLRLYWAIANVALPVVETDLPLREGECTHFRAPGAEWLAVARVTTTVDHRAERASFAEDSLKLFHSEPSDTVFSQQVTTSDAVTPVDTGELFITNQRLRFRGGNSERRVEFGDILAIEERERQLWLTVPDGRRIVLQLPRDADLALLLLSRLLREAPAASQPVHPEQRISIPTRSTPPAPED